MARQASVIPSSGGSSGGGSTTVLGSAEWKTRRRIYQIPGSYTFTVPEGINKVLVMCFGGGALGSVYGGHGGGAISCFVPVTEKQNIPIIVASKGNTSNNGSPSAFGSFLTCEGGKYNFIGTQSNKVIKSSAITYIIWEAHTSTVNSIGGSGCGSSSNSSGGGGLFGTSGGSGGGGLFGSSSSGGGGGSTISDNATANNGAGYLAGKAIAEKEDGSGVPITDIFYSLAVLDIIGGGGGNGGNGGPGGGGGSGGNGGPGGGGGSGGNGGLGGGGGINRNGGLGGGGGSNNGIGGPGLVCVFW